MAQNRTIKTGQEATKDVAIPPVTKGRVVCRAADECSAARGRVSCCDWLIDGRPVAQSVTSAQWLRGGQISEKRRSQPGRSAGCAVRTNPEQQLSRTTTNPEQVLQ